MTMAAMVAVLQDLPKLELLLKIRVDPLLESK